MNRVVAYTFGLGLAVILTLAAFGLVLAYAVPGMRTPGFVVPEVLVLAMVQLTVQLVFFLHLGRDKDSRWHALLFGFTFFGILVVVLASVWIMYHLNYNMTPTEMDQYITNQSSF